jgi:hypothetical protein
MEREEAHAPHLRVAALTLMAASGRDTGPAITTGRRYDAAAVRRLFPRPVAVGLAAASLFIGGVVLAGALLRNRDTPRPAHHSTSTTAATTTGRPRP